MSSERVDRLEERLAWLERHVTAQDKAMLELHEEIDRLRAALAALQSRSETTPGGGDTSPDPASFDERPPHY